MNSVGSRGRRASRGSLPAKLTPPALPDVVRRARLFRLLDRASRRGLVWVSGPPGAGKTTLVASYLAARGLSPIWYQLDAGDADPATLFHYLGRALARGARSTPRRLPAWSAVPRAELRNLARRTFEEACAARRSSGVIVLDNFQEVPLDSDSHVLLQEAFELAPDRMTVFVISRSAPPVALARLRAAGRVEEIGWESVKLSEAEGAALVRRRLARGGRRRTRAEVTSLCERAEGWAAGLVLLSDDAAHSKDALAALTERAPHVVFEYLAGEALARLDAARQRFLLVTALVPSISEAIACDLTGVADSGAILKEMVRDGFFTERRALATPEFQYHPLFRSFLSARAERELGSPELAALRVRAGSALAAAGRWEEACDLLLASGDHAALSRVVLEAAPAWHTQSRYATIERWISAISPDLVDDDPWLLYWLGASRLPRDSGSSREPFERAYATFRERGDHGGALSAWCGAVESVLSEMGSFRPLDAWLERVDELLASAGGFPSREVEARFAAAALAAHTFRCPERVAAMVAWSERAMQLLPHLSDMRQRMFTGYHLTLAMVNGGAPAVAELLIDQLREAARGPNVTPEALLTWKLAESVYQWIAGDPRACLAAVVEGEAIAASAGIRGWTYQLAAQGLCASLVLQDSVRGAAYLERMRPVLETKRHLEISEYHFLSAWHAAARGDWRLAQERLRLSHGIAVEAGAPYPIFLNHLALAQVAAQRGDADGAHGWLAAARAFTDQAPLPFSLHRLGLVSAWVDSQLAVRSEGRPDPAPVPLRDALSVGRQNALFLRFFWWRPDAMSRLCADALRAGIETEYVGALVRRLDVPASDPSSCPSTWPWPIRVRTLGAFAIERDGVALDFRSKAQRRPLEMLKVLIALGGRSVPEERLADTLWPDADGDAAHQVFATTLHRLRRLLGRDDALILSEGQLTIDRRVCWIDALCLEQVLEGPEREARRGDARPLEAERRDLKASLELYRGPFLPEAADARWAATPRERLRACFLRASARLGGLLEAAGEWDAAMACYEDALGVDDLAEGLYQSLMRCCHRAGRRGEVAAVYERCRRTLRAVIGIEPSAATRELLASLSEET